MKNAAGLAVSMICGVAFAQTDAYQATVRQGIELHDRGEFDAAIKVYESVLADKPGDPLVMYEMALTYQAKQDYARCMEFAGQVAARPSDQQSGGLTLLANCQDDAGQVEQAVATFKQAIEKYPRDVMLNLNYGLTLVRLEQPAEARQVLGVAIEAAPGFPSPYRAYAMALDQQSCPGSALLTRLRFIMSEPESERAIDAAKLIVASMTAAMGGPQDQITVSKPDESVSDMASMTATELAFALAARASADKEGAAASASARFAIATQLFLTMKSEIFDKEKDPEHPWPAVLEPLMLLSKQNALEPFLYHVAALGRSEGALQWINEHSDSMDRLADAINEYHARFKPQ